MRYIIFSVLKWNIHSNSKVVRFGLHDPMSRQNWFAWAGTPVPARASMFFPWYLWIEVSKAEKKVSVKLGQGVVSWQGKIMCTSSSAMWRHNVKVDNNNTRREPSKKGGGFTLWLSKLRSWCCHCYSLGHCCSMGWNPGPGTSTHALGERKRKREREKEHPY